MGPSSPENFLPFKEPNDHSKVIRVDRGFGLLLEVPTSPIPTPAYVSVSDVADKDVRKLEKNFKQGSHVRARILGFRHLEGLAMGVLKSSAFEGSVFTHSDVKPGMVVRAKVTVVDNFGAIVQFPSGVKSLCPLRHMSEFEIAKPRKKFQVGAELQFRVLGCKSKRITVTHKKTLVCFSRLTMNKLINFKELL
ncbi:rRNA biogenesis protein RRP5-like [Camellia sinensis]|uniref:rRNA biogenesis protein RRP5-like n=1 Tax=Camellia sinensis TaxID=4442 RepID=UPI0010358489|nr:rRNA biogenesis protein RRP5-like [Camellia sinensis]